MNPGFDDVLPRVCEAFDAVDPETGWYLDTVTPRVVVVRNGVTDVPGLEAAEVELDDDRFAAIPAVLPHDAFGWMLDFVEERDDPAVAELLDARAGAHERFPAALSEADPEAATAWRAYRAVRLSEHVAAWIAEVSVA